MTSRDVAVVGGGVVGLAVAWRLAQRGFDVVVFERDEPGSGASRAAAGMLAPTAEYDFQETELLELGLESLERYPDFVDELEAASGRDVDYRTEGTLVVADDRDDAEVLDRLLDHYDQLGLDARRLGAKEARELEPGLAADLRGAVLCAGDHQVDPRRLVDALAVAARRAGADIETSTPVDAIWREEDRRGVTLREGRVAAERIVVAAGAWSSEIGGIPEGVLPHLRPVRGQMIATDLGTPPICEHVIRAPDPSQMNVYLVPKSRGRLLIGATSEERGFDDRMTAGGTFELLRGAYETLPGIYDRHIVDMWTGFRPVTLDEQPVFGPTDVDGLWIAVGHGRDGILLTPITADAIAAGMTDGTIPRAVEPFTPNRRTR